MYRANGDQAATQAETPSGYFARQSRASVGIDADRAERISDYDFRHSAATHLGRTSDNLPGVMYLLGHKQPATTGRYMRPQKDAASEVLQAAAAANAAQFRSHSVTRSLPGPRRRRRPQKDKTPNHMK